VCGETGHEEADGGDIVCVVGVETAGAQDRKSNIFQTIVQQGKKKDNRLAVAFD
jgi:hypothetical protein